MPEESFKKKNGGTFSIQVPAIHGVQSLTVLERAHLLLHGKMDIYFQDVSYSNPGPSEFTSDIPPVLSQPAEVMCVPLAPHRLICLLRCPHFSS